MTNYEKARLEKLQYERDIFLQHGYKLTAAARQREIDQITGGRQDE